MVHGDVVLEGREASHAAGGLTADPPVACLAAGHCLLTPAVSSKGRPYRRIVFEGYTILIGKGDVENDRLTFEVAEPEDLWLHVAGGVAGSHVVVRNPDPLVPPPRAVVERAAELAAWYSKGRGAGGKVEVHVCRAADVSKPRGFAPGKVLLARWQRLRVYPRGVEPRATSGE